MSTPANRLFPDLSPNAELNQKIDALQKNELEDALLGYPAQVVDLLGSLAFVRVTGTWFENRPSGEKMVSVMEEGHLAALHALNLPLVYAVFSGGGEKRLLLGSRPEGLDTLTQVLRGISGRCHVEAQHRFDGDLKKFTCAAVTGIPHRPRTRPDQGGTTGRRSILDSPLTVLSTPWIYLTVSVPLRRTLAGTWLQQCAMEVQTTTERFLRDPSQANRLARRYVGILDAMMTRFRKGQATGVWQNGIFLFSGTGLAPALALVMAGLSGPGSKPEPIRGHVCGPGAPPAGLENLLISEELAILEGFPQREYQGFCLREHIEFDQDFRNNTAPALSLGTVSNHDDDTGTQVTIPVEDLTRHGLVAGATGSGKTNTLFHLLLQLWGTHRVPFLVIEPAKAEYRALCSQIPEMLVFTVGDERPGHCAPLRLNPFAFSPGVALQTHIDLLKAVFNASFVMYAPTPYILEECLYEIYTDRGWQIASSTNHRGAGPLAFPTLSDLYYKVDEVVDRIGYDERTAMDIRSALKTRINNLRVGGKGLMLDTRASISFADLMARPALLELRSMGSDDEKAFVMGLVLTAMYEYYENGAQPTGRGLRHLTLIEEAHRLLKNVPFEKTSEEQASMRGKAVETFCNLLSEVRARGEGILVAEQIPTKLAPDLIKNTNLKVLHRMVSREEREIMGAAMNMAPDQLRRAAALIQGQAVVFMEKMDRPLLAHIPLAAVDPAAGGIDSRELNRRMLEGFYGPRLPLLLRYPHCRACRLHLSDGCEASFSRAQSWAGRDRRAAAVRRFLPLMVAGAEDPGRDAAGERQNAAYCLEAQLTAAYLEEKAGFLDLSYDALASALQEAAGMGDRGDRRKSFRRRCLDLFARPNPPYAGCRDACSDICLFGYDVAVIGRDPALYECFRTFVDACEGSFDGAELVTVLKREIAEWIAAPIADEALQKLAACYIIQRMNEMGIRPDPGKY